MSLHSPAPSTLKTSSCPHLGIREDPQTCLGYPSEWNLCYHAWPVAAVSLEQQRLQCLSPVYTRCPVYLRRRRAPLPRQLRAAWPVNRLRLAALVLLLILAALGLWAAWQTYTGGAVPFGGAISFPF